MIDKFRTINNETISIPKTVKANHLALNITSKYKFIYRALNDLLPLSGKETQDVEDTLVNFDTTRSNREEEKSFKI